MKNKIKILVSGVSGVGKTTLCANFCKENPFVAHLEASKFVHGLPIGFNQEDVVRFIIQELDRRHECCGLVDGHLILRDMEVPVNAIRMLSPRAIIIVVDEPNFIQQRRNKDLNRVRENESVQKINRIQKNEVAYARMVANIIGIRCLVIEANQKLEFNEFAKRELLSNLSTK